jgi:spermidine synthase
MRKYLYLAVFFSGMASLAVEFGASRLLGNYFGTSNIIWASIIGLILIYLTVGYFLGGRWADNSPRFKTFFSILCWAGFAVGLVPVLSRPILILASRAFEHLSFGILIGSFLSVLVLFSIPVTLLGTASPFAIRLSLNDTKMAGKVSGRIYAVSTLGSFLGTFLSTLVLIPLIGTYRTFLVFSAAMLLVALIAMWRTVDLKSALIYLWMPVIIIILALIGLPGRDKGNSNVIYETESSYNFIQVQQIDGSFLLRLNEGEGIHSIYDPQKLITDGPWDQVIAAPFFNADLVDPNQVRSMAIVGLAAGTSAREASIFFSNIQIDGFEIDPKIIAVARQYFDMNEPNLTVIVQDGRIALHESSKLYQVISIDAYRPPYIPWQLTTQEFFQDVHDHLTEDGVMVINVGRSPTDRLLVNSLFNTIRSIFPSAYIMDIPNSLNSMIFATSQPTNLDDFRQNLDHLSLSPDVDPLLLHVLRVTASAIMPEPKLDPRLIFTDDRAPVEWITNGMVLSFLFSSEVSIIR